MMVSRSGAEDGRSDEAEAEVEAEAGLCPISAPVLVVPDRSVDQ
jgi:hypothetical protein